VTAEIEGIVMRLVRTFLLAASLASLPALAMAQTNTGVAVGIFTGGALAGPAGAFAGGLIGGATGAAADVATAPLYEGRTVYVPPYPTSLAPGYIAPGPVYGMPEDGPLRRRCWTNVYGERQCETVR
jgi:hypothetical protein